MMKAGEPVAYQTTDEGALAWVDGITLSAKADNIDEAYELIIFIRLHFRIVKHNNGN